MTTRRSRGFTVVELLVVVGLLAILAALLAPALLRSRENARQSYCVNNLNQIYGALRIYASDWDGVYPTEFLADAVQATHNSNSILTCPSDDLEIDPHYGDQWAGHQDKRTSYDWAGPMLNLTRIGVRSGRSFADKIAFMESTHPSAGLVTCAHHGYLQNRYYNRPGNVVRLAFDGSVKTVIFIPPAITDPNKHVQWSLIECLGWDARHMN